VHRKIKRKYSSGPIHIKTLMNNYEKKYLEQIFHSEQEEKEQKTRILTDKRY
jgi:hypothetical protein